MQEAAAAATVVKISGAMTNLVFKAHSPLAGAVIVRVFGPGSRLFSRRQERSVFLAAARQGLGPRCLLEFGNGRVEEFLPGTTLTAEGMRRPRVAAAVATALAQFHVAMHEALPLVGGDAGCVAGDGVEGGGRSALWARLSRWVAIAQQVAPADSRALGLDAALEEVDAMQEAIQRCDRRWGGVKLLVFCHNDLQHANILLQDGGDAAVAGEGAGRDEPLVEAKLIDFEYAMVGEAEFDIANHFCEYAADYHGSSEAHILDWSRLPTWQEQTFFCRAYAAAVLQRFGSSALARALQRCAAPGVAGGSLAEADGVEEAAAAAVRRRAVAFMPLSHLMWAAWGLIQSKTSDVSAEFDYRAYAEQRMMRYHATKVGLEDVGGEEGGGGGSGGV